MFGFIPKEIPKTLQAEIKSIPEETANMISHVIGLIAFILGIPFLLFLAYQSNNNWYFAGVIIYSISLLMVYTSSTLYHSIYTIQLRKKLRIFDHISIYFLIAGTYTPFILTYIKNPIGWTVFTILWSMAVSGSVFKLFFTHRFNLISTLAYLTMGWILIFIIKPLHELVPAPSFMWIIIGGLLYTIGIIFYLWKNLYHSHLIWHLFVLGGSISHFIAVYFCT